MSFYLLLWNVTASSTRYTTGRKGRHGKRSSNKFQTDFIVLLFRTSFLWLRTWDISLLLSTCKKGVEHCQEKYEEGNALLRQEWHEEESPKFDSSHQKRRRHTRREEKEYHLLGWKIKSILLLKDSLFCKLENDTQLLFLDNGRDWRDMRIKSFFSPWRTQKRSLPWKCTELFFSLWTASHFLKIPIWLGPLVTQPVASLFVKSTSLFLWTFVSPFNTSSSLLSIHLLSFILFLYSSCVIRNFSLYKRPSSPSLVLKPFPP